MTRHSSLVRASLADILRFGRGPAIWRTRTLEGQVDLPRVGLAAFVTVELVHARTGLVRQRLEFKNMLMDAFVDVGIGGGTFAPGSILSNWIGVGTGATPPAANQTGLVAGLTPRKQNTMATRGSGASFSYVYASGQVTWTEAEVNGNLTEFGVFSASTGGTMFARQLFRDALGNPTTVSKTSADQLRLTYEVRAYPPASAADVVGVSNISGVNYDWQSNVTNLHDQGIVWQQNLNSSPNALSIRAGTRTTMPAPNTNTGTGGATLASSYVNTAYVTGTYYVDREAWWEPATVTTPITSFCIHGGGGAFPVWWIIFQPTAIPKDNTKRLKLTFRLPWGRYP